MIAPLLSALLFVALNAPMPVSDEPKLEGTWICIKGERDGVASDNPVGSKLIFADGAVSVEEKGKDRMQKGKYKVDDTKSPRHITLTPDDSQQAGAEELVGIYEIKDGKLTLCLARPNTERPSELKTSEGSNRMLMVFEREKE